MMQGKNGESYPAYNNNMAAFLKEIEKHSKGLGQEGILRRDTYLVTGGKGEPLRQYAL